ncbi:ftsK/SpoIIIE family protein [Clostridium sp. CAG:253]|nr:ftsK/SpoIIIE family protein [Clostridium sp. CAG:253]
MVEEDTTETQKESKPERDEYFEEAGRFVIESDRAAAGQLQRRFSIGFNRAGRIIDQLHKAGVVGPAEGTKPRKILMSKNEFEMMLGNAPEPVSEEEIDAITEEFGQQ